MTSPFRIDVLDGSGNVIADSMGSLRNVLSLNTVEFMDKIGSLSFVVPANDPKTALITSASYFDVYTQDEGYLGRFVYDDKAISNTDGTATISIKCWNMLHELSTQIAGFGRDYTATAVETVIADLLGDVSPAWTLSIGTGLGTTNVTYQGHFFFDAIEDLAKRWGYHFRLNSTLRQLEFGAFGVTNTNVRLTNLKGQHSSFDSRTDVAILKRISLKSSKAQMYNRVVVLGAGEGAAQLQLKNAEVGASYTVQNRTRTNGQTEYYIEDSASITANGLREIPLIFDQVRPLSNTATAKTQAQSELLKNGEIWLERHKDPREQIDNVQVYGLRTELKVGQKVNIRYKGLDNNGVLYLDIDGDYWITQKSVSRNVRGSVVTTLQLVNVDLPELTDIDMLSKAVKGIRSQRLWIKPTAFRQSDTYIDYVQHGNGSYQDKEAEFTLTFDDTVTEVTRVILEIRTKPIYSMSIWTFPAGGKTGVNNAGGDPHDHNYFGSLDGAYQILTDGNYPTDVSIEIDGTNIDNHVNVDYLTGGTGPWNNGGTPNAALNLRMDITDFILNAGIYNTFDVVVKLNAARTRDIAVQFWSSTDPSNLPYGNHGVVEAKFLVQGVAQGIYKD